MPSTTIQRGNIATNILMQISITPAAVTTATTTEQTFAVPGLQTGDAVSSLSFQGAWPNLTSIVNTRVTASNVIGVSFQNGTAGTLTPPAGVYILEINRAEYLPLPNNAI